MASGLLTSRWIGRVRHDASDSLAAHFAAVGELERLSLLRQTPERLSQPSAASTLVKKMATPSSLLL